MKRVGFIGLGNMAEAIIKGLISSGNFKCEEIGAFRTDTDKLNKSAKELGITAFSSNEELVENCECVVLAVKPNALQKVLEPIKEVMRKANPLVISIAAGQTTDKLTQMIGFNAPIVRVMPNINAIVGKAVSGYTNTQAVTDEQLNIAVKILNSFGTSVPVEEENFSAFSAIAGCSPAYVYLFIDAISRVGVKYGLTKKEALEIVTDTVLNTASDSTDIETSQLDEIVLNAINAAYNKDKGMGK